MRRYYTYYKLAKVHNSSGQTVSVAPHYSIDGRVAVMDDGCTSDNVWVSICQTLPGDGCITAV